MECLIVGNNLFTSTPEWYLNGASLSLSDSLTYLGTCLGDQRGQEHVAKRSQKANKAFYTLQGAGLNTFCVSPETASHVYQTAVRSSLTYGCAAINISDRNIKLLDSSQGKFVKTILGIPYSSRTTPILQSLFIDPVFISVKKSELDLLQQCLLSDSATQSFYHYLFSVWNNGERKLLSNTLLYRVLSYCDIKHINFTKYITNDVYKKCIKGSISAAYNDIVPGTNGLVDSLRNLFSNYNSDSRTITSLLTKSF